MANSIAIDLCANDEARLDFLFRVQKADVANLRLVVELESLAFTTVIDGDVVAVDGFDDPGKGFTFSFLSKL